jgi:hypothetical protein
MVEGRLDRGPVDRSAARGQPFPKHLAPTIESQQRDVRRPIDLGEPLTESDEGGVEIRRHAERVSEGSECARRHREEVRQRARPA